MDIISIIGIIIPSIAAILAGVWFIVQRAFKSGINSNRLAEIEKRTCNARCDLHSQDIDSLKQDIKEMKGDIIAIKSLLMMKHKNASNIFSIKSSPRRLNENGMKLLAAINGNEFLQKNKDFLFSKVDGYKPKTALDVENAANIACTTNIDNEIFNDMKYFVYNSPSFLIKDENGKECSYDISLSDICFVLSIPLRDMYLEAHVEIPLNPEK